MNIEAYNLDTLRKLVRNLQKENRELRALLQRANVPCAQSEAFLDTPEKAEDYDPDQAEAGNGPFPSERIPGGWDGCDRGISPSAGRDLPVSGIRF